MKWGLDINIKVVRYTKMENNGRSEMVLGQSGGALTYLKVQGNRNMFNERVKNMRRKCNMNFSEIFPYVFSLLVGYAHGEELI